MIVAVAGTYVSLTILASAHHNTVPLLRSHSSLPVNMILTSLARPLKSLLPLSNVSRKKEMTMDKM